MEWLLIPAGVAALLIVVMVVISGRRSGHRSQLDPSRDVFFGDREPRPPHGPFDANTEGS